jgi:hypothetical protein
MARSFNGTSDAIDGGTAYTFKGASALSVCGWVRLNSASDERTFMSNWSASPTSGELLIRINGPGGDVQTQIYTSAGQSGGNTGLTITDTDDHHLAVVWNGATLTAYLDGAAGATTYANAGSFGSSTTALTLGNDPRGGAAETGLDGAMAEVGIYTSALSVPEIAALAKGYAPSLVRPTSLAFYAPLIRDVVAYRGSIGSASGTTVADHPRMIYPARSMVGKRLRGSYTSDSRDVSAILNSWAADQIDYGLVGFDSHVADQSDASSVLVSYASDQRDTSAVYNAVIRDATDRSAVYNAVIGDATDAGTVYTAVVMDSRDWHRVASAASDRYELYIGTDALPDLTADPDETFASLPHTTAAGLLPTPVSGTATYYIVVRKRNAYGLLSQNVYARRIIVGDDGQEDVPSPSDPSTLAVDAATATAIGAGKIKITARYEYARDGDNKADKWALYITSDGTDPDPATDTPVLVSVSTLQRTAALNYTTDAYANGTTVKVLVRLRRTSDSAESANTDIITATAVSLTASSITLSDTFLGDRAVQR